MEQEKNEKGKVINLEGLKQNATLKLMVECGLIDEQGIRISGNGLVITKLDAMKKLIDKTNINLYHIEKALKR